MSAQLPAEPGSAATARVTDVHIHIQPWRQLKPGPMETMRRGSKEHFAFLMELMDNPAMLLRIMDEQGIDRVGLVNYPAPGIMGFDDSTNEFSVRYASADPRRLLPYGGVDPLTTPDPAGATDRLAAMGIRVLKLHPPHQNFAANAYTDGLAALASIYRRAESLGLPVMVHTGTSVFPGARSKYGNPMDLDDVAIDFPDLRIIMAHGGRPLYMEEAFFILRRHRNVWLDLSGIPPQRLLDYFPRIHELEDKLLWGTDWPSPGVTSMAKNVGQFRALGLSPALERATLESNAARLLPARE
ncbi:MAG: amidohydrolase family protein [Gemmatimonadota bacterium]|nr:amidohydrolase family protein [Gemmatimonadota bacterium]